MNKNMITTIRNGSLIRSPYVKVPKTELNYNIARVLEQEGFVYLPSEVDQARGFNKKSYFFIGLKYKVLRGNPYITNILRVSTPGQRIYCSKKNIPRVFGGIGVAICLNILIVLFLYK